MKRHTLDPAMMTVEEADLFKRMSDAYDQIVSTLDGNKLDREEAFSLIAQIACQLTQDDQQDFLWTMEQFYKIERFMRPEPKEIH